ncbi:MAG: DNA/RNA nuclease SfsA [Ruminococcus sp.]|nr:DNA/RNA nuclease SfsA [Ruminococcus sp.]
MRYKNITEGRFISRPNRFIAKVEIDGKEETVHVKNTGRCKELLVTGCRVYLEKSGNPARKTAYDLVAVEKRTESGETLLINMDSQIPNYVAEEWLKISGMFSENAVIRREVTYGNSRFDVYVKDGNRRAFIEVKGVTLEYDGTAMFPDAPTQRGVKHIRELMKCTEEGYEAYILFVIQMERVNEFRPNDATDKEFGKALREAEKAGVKILAQSCVITADSIEIKTPVKVIL